MGGGEGGWARAGQQPVAVSGGGVGGWLGGGDACWGGCVLSWSSDETLLHTWNYRLPADDKALMRTT